MALYDQQHEQPKSFTITVHILIAFVVALGIRIYFWLKFPHVIFLHEADGIAYISIARNIIENFSINNATHFPPFYPALIAIISVFIGSFETGARLVSILMGSGMVVPLYLACCYLMTSRAALCVALLSACFGTFVEYSLQPLSQATYIGLIALDFWLCLRCFRYSSPFVATAVGLTSAAIYLTRPEGMLLFFFAAPILIYAILKSEASLKQRLSNICLLCFSFFIPFIWYVFQLKRFTGVWAVSGKSVTLIGTDASMKVLPGGQTFGEIVTKGGINQLIPNISTILKNIVSQSDKLTQVAASLLPNIAFVIAAMGVLLLIIRYERSGRITIFLETCLVLVPLVTLLPVIAIDKFLPIPGFILPLFLVIFACFIHCCAFIELRLAGFLEKRITLSARLIRNLPLTVVATVFMVWYTFLPFYRHISSEEFQYYSSNQNFLLRQTGQWFRNNTDKSSILMARWSNIGYYGERSWVGLVDGSIAEVIDYAKRHGVTHIVIDSDSLSSRRPQLAALLSPSNSHPGLKRVYADEQFGTRVIVYRVN